MHDFYFLPKQKIAVFYLSNFKAKMVLEFLFHLYLIVVNLKNFEL